jgi:hypothetical protein
MQIARRRTFCRVGLLSTAVKVAQGMTAFIESTVDYAALAWLKALGWQVAYGLDIASGELRVKEAERVTKETTV